MEIRIEGAEKLQQVAKQLRAAGEQGKGLRRELLRGIRAAAAPLKPEIAESALRVLPRRGGLAALVAGSRFGVRTRTGGNAVGVRVVATSRVGVARIDDGSVRHPVFGHRDRWVTEKVTPGWFTGPTLRAEAGIQARVSAAMDDVARQITK